MKTMLFFTLILFLFSCGSVSMSNGRQKIIINGQSTPCDIHRKEIDPHCKTENKSQTPQAKIKADNPSAE